MAKKKTPKNFESYLSKLKKNFLKSEGRTYWTEKREEEFWKLPSFKKGQSKKEKALNKARRLRQSNLQRGEKRHTEKGTFVFTEDFVKHKKPFTPTPPTAKKKTLILLENEMIFGDNFSILKQAAAKPNIKNIIVFDNTTSKKGASKPQISFSQDIATAITDIKDNFDMWTNYDITAIEKDDNILIFVNGSYDSAETL